MVLDGDSSVYCSIAGATIMGRTNFCRNGYLVSVCNIAIAYTLLVYFYMCVYVYVELKHCFEIFVRICDFQHKQTPENVKSLSENLNNLHKH